MFHRVPFPSPGGSPGDRSSTGPVRKLILFLNPFVFAFCLACVWLGMREILRMGGFVASGGPYAIAHEAPGWVWVMPLSIVLMVASILTAVFTGIRSGGPNIMLFSWSALFLSLGWNFLESGFGIGTGGPVAWGWVVCAALFLPMGILPLIPAVRMLTKAAGESAERHGWTRFLAQAVCASGGAVLGAAFFRSLL